MPDEDIDETDEQNSQADETGDDNDTGSDQDEADTGQPDVETLMRQKKHWREKAVDPKTGKTYKTLYEEAQKKEKPDVSQKPSSPSFNPDLIETKVDLRLAGHSKAEIDFMETYAKGKGKKLSEIVNDENIKTAIEAMRNKSKSDQGTPPPSSRTGGQPGGEQKTPFHKLPKVQQQQAWREKLDAQKGKNTGGQFE